MKPALSVSMIVKNEREMLPRCLRSVAGAQEIVILDTGSTDDTAEVVAALGMAHVRFIAGQYEWQDHFAHARNAAKSLCSHPWILTIDADEYLEDGGMEIIQRTIERNDAMAYNVRTQAEGGSAWHWSSRLYRNVPAHDWHGAAHNYQNIRSAQTLPVTIFYDHSPAHATDPNRTLRILTNELATNPLDPRTLYYLGSEWHRRRKYDAAANYLSSLVNREENGYYHAEAYLMLARCLWALRKGNEARIACFHAIEINAHFKEAIAFMAELTFPRNRPAWLAMAAAATNENVMFVRTP